MNGISGLSEAHNLDIAEESNDKNLSYDKRVKDASSELKALLTTNKDHGQKPSEVPQDNKDGKHAKASKNQSIKPDALSLINRQVGLGDLKRGIAEEFAQNKQTQQQSRIIKQLKSQVPDLVKTLTDSTNYADLAMLSSKTPQAQKKQAELRNKKLSSLQQEAKTSAQSPNPWGVSLSRQKKQKSNASLRQAMPEKGLKKSQNQHMANYVGLFAKSLLDPQKKSQKDQRELKQAKAKLLASSSSSSLISQIEQGAKRFVGQQLKKTLKKNFLESLIHYDAAKMEKGLACQTALNQYEVFRHLIKRSNYANADANFELQFLREDVRDELRSYVAQELDRVLIEIRLKTNNQKTLADAMDRFNALIQNSQFQAPEYARSLNHKLDAQGLRLFEVPYQMGMIDSDWERRKKNLSPDLSFMGGKSQEDQVLQHFYTLYSTPALFKQIKLRYQLHQEKQKHYQGENGKKKWAHLAKQGKLLAIYSLLSRLRQCFEERALLPDLSGDTFNFIKDQILTLSKQLKHLGRNMSTSALRDLRDDANSKVFSALKEHYIRVDIQLKANPKELYLQRESRKLYKMLMRLKKESRLKESILPSMFNSSTLAEKTISEAA
eukprot:COSAG01_NODE_6_length_54687_cov_500.907599_4_plen_607_part_00